MRNECHFFHEIEYGDFNYAIGENSTTRPLLVYYAQTSIILKRAKTDAREYIEVEGILVIKKPK